MKRGEESSIIGKKFGKLTIQSKFEYRGSNVNYLYFECLCDCGNSKFISWGHIRGGNTKSCGCLRNIGYRRLPKGQASRNAAIRVYRINAKKRNIDFKLTDNEVFIFMKSNCHYCNMPPSNLWKSRCKNGNFIYNGIDRKDNNLGYTLNNCVSCCKVCNYFKRDMDYDEFLGLVFRIYDTRVFDIELVSFGELIDKLSTVTIKLYKLCDDKIDMSKYPENYSVGEINSLAERDIELCKQRAKLKGEIDRLLMGKYASEEIKAYGVDK